MTREITPIPEVPTRSPQQPKLQKRHTITKATREESRWPSIYRTAQPQRQRIRQSWKIDDKASAKMKNYGGKTIAKTQQVYHTIIMTAFNKKRILNFESTVHVRRALLSSSERKVWPTPSSSPPRNRIDSTVTIVYSQNYSIHVIDSTVTCNLVTRCRCYNDSLSLFARR